MRDTPQSCGLPSIEEHTGEYPPDEKVQDRERELSVKEILFTYVLNNKFLWYIAIANVFVYFVRYGVVDWAPTYLVEEKALLIVVHVQLTLYMNGLVFQVHFFAAG